MTFITVHSSTEDKTELETEEFYEELEDVFSLCRNYDMVTILAYRGPNCDSDHYLVRAAIVQRLSKTKETPKSTRKNWNIEKLNLKDRSDEYQMSIERKLFGYLENRNIDDKWNDLETIIKEAEEEEIGERRRERNSDWFEEVFNDAIRNKNQARGIQEAIEKNIKDYEE
ncbi:hypothetical protein J437_LFUL000533 [Ladona fulva]|uniref:Uncharacterized protein n=1 Tax=Ladona fulva TaxID=123851 RepID=A0A8K0JXL5_LADFU|nr:hypothetical protein J437_LFUL000533 [Ladona fulva]